jgi:PAS domain S-box-containing protein
MTSTPSANGIQTSRYAIPIFLALIAAGLAGNYFKLSILNADFIFGSIFAMLALQRFGLGRGVVAAAVIAGYTYLAWNHPWAVVTMTAEAAVVGWLISRRKMNLVMADALYWLFIGIPLGYLCFHVISDFPVSNTLFLMTKQGINGIANALVARLVFTGFTLRSNAARITFREAVSNLLIFFVLCPSLILLTLESKADLAETDRQIRTTLIRDSRSMTDSLQNWVEDRKRPVVHLAAMAEKHSAAQMQTRLEQTCVLDNNFLRIGLLDRKANLTAIFPLIDDLGQRNIGKNYADRPFIPKLKRTLEPMLSEVVMGRINIPEPVVIMLAPVVILGKYNGYVSGVLSFDRIRTVLKINSAGNDSRYTLLDENGKVIITNRSDQKAMMPFTRAKGSLSRPLEGITQWVPVLPPNTSTIELWGKSLYVAESAIGNLAEWKLILEQPVLPFQKRLYNAYTGKLFMLFAILLMALLLAEFLSRRIVQPIDKLTELTQAMPSKLASTQQIVWPKSNTVETDHLIANFKEMADSLRETFGEIRRMNELLELRIEERTEDLIRVNDDLRKEITDRSRAEEALVTSSKLLQDVTDSSPALIYTVDAAGRFMLMNRRLEALFGIPSVALIGKTRESFMPPEIAANHRANDQQVIADRQPITFEEENEERDGKHTYLSIKFPLLDLQGAVSGICGISTDITDLKRGEEALLEANRKLRASQIAALNILEDLKAENKVRIENEVEIRRLNAELEQRVTERTAQLEAANKELEAFSYSVSHDLRAPLRAVDGYTRILVEDFGPLLDNEGRRVCSVISESARNMGKLIDDLLAFSRIGRTEMNYSSVDMATMANSIFFELTTPGGREPIDFHVAPLPPAQGDPALLRQVWANLLGNAVKFSSKTERAVIEVTAEEQGGKVVYRVRDNGAGFDMQYANKLFGVFQRLHGAREFEGTGVGLAIVQRIVLRHGGKIWAEAEVGKGAVFYFTIA